MLLVPPAELSGKIMTLIDQCQEKMVVISPYLRLLHWKKLTRRIAASRKRGVTYEWYYRSDQDYHREFRTLGVVGIPVEKLHAKIYYNESQALVTSMNLHQYSDDNSIDIGYLTETAAEHQEIMTFVDQFIRPAVVTVRECTSRKHDLPRALSTTASLREVISRPSSITDRRQSLNLYDSISQIVRNYVDQLVTQGQLQAAQVSKRRDVTVTDYSPGLDLTFDIRGSYDRFILQPTGRPYKLKRHRYDLLVTERSKLEQIMGSPFDLGNQMKRLKWDIPSEQRVFDDGVLHKGYRHTVVRVLDRVFGPLHDALPADLARAV